MHFIFFLLVSICILVDGQLVDPYPVSNCNNALGGTALQCPNQPGCCSGGAACCAGGCCPLSAVCVNSGTADEACCDALDKSRCGTVATDVAPSCPSATGFHASKLCVGADGSWYCAWNAACNLAGGGCFRRRAVRDDCGASVLESQTSIDEFPTSATDFVATTDTFLTTDSTDTSTSRSTAATSTSLAAASNNHSAVFLIVLPTLVGVWLWFWLGLN